jgi:hypothetical protein
VIVNLDMHWAAPSTLELVQMLFKQRRRHSYCSFAPRDPIPGAMGIKDESHAHHA